MKEHIAQVRGSINDSEEEHNHDNGHLLGLWQRIIQTIHGGRSSMNISSQVGHFDVAQLDLMIRIKRFSIFLDLIDQFRKLTEYFFNEIFPAWSVDV